MRALFLAFACLGVARAQDTTTPAPVPLEGGTITFWTATRTPFAESLTAALQAAFPRLQVHSRQLTPPELLPALNVAGQTGGVAPELIYLEDAAAEKLLLAQGARLVVGHPAWAGKGVWMVPQSAPDPKAAEALVRWLGRTPASGETRHNSPPEADAASSAAEAAVRGFACDLKAPSADVLDPAAASFDWGSVSTRRAGGAEQQTCTPQVAGVAGNERLAVAVASAWVAGADFLGTLHYLVVLRHPQSAWRTLLFLPVETPADARIAVDLDELPLQNGQQPGTALLLQLSPAEAARVGRRPVPELVFEQEGELGAAYAIESQTFDTFHSLWTPPAFVLRGNGTQPSHMVKVPAPGTIPRHPYRWRVWSIGASGNVTLSDWRNLEIN